MMLAQGMERNIAFDHHTAIGHLECGGQVLGRVLVHAAADFFVHASYASGSLKKAFALRVLANSLKQKTCCLLDLFLVEHRCSYLYRGAMGAWLENECKLTSPERNSLAFEILPEPLDELSPRRFHHQKGLWPQGRPGIRIAHHTRLQPPPQRRPRKPAPRHQAPHFPRIPCNPMGRSNIRVPRHVFTTQATFGYLTPP